MGFLTTIMSGGVVRDTKPASAKKSTPMATTAVPLTQSISDALSKAFKKSPALEELWQKVNTRIDETQKELGQVDVNQQQMQAAVATAGTSGPGLLGGISPGVIVAAVLLLLWWWRSK